MRRQEQLGSRTVAAAIAAAAIAVLVSACGQQPVIDERMRRVEGPLPADLSGSWERSYARDDPMSRVVQQAWDELSRTSSDPYMRNDMGMPAPSSRDADVLLALAQLGELITRFDSMRIVQDDTQIRIEREDDFALECAFDGGRARRIETPAGSELCGWAGDQLVSELVLTDGLTILNLFTISADGQELRITTTLRSTASRVPVTIRRFYRKYEEPVSGFHCIETLSMKRVCSTSEILP
jgi:hypothetical protein